LSVILLVLEGLPCHIAIRQDMSKPDTKSPNFGNRYTFLMNSTIHRKNYYWIQALVTELSIIYPKRFQEPK